MLFVNKYGSVCFVRFQRAAHNYVKVTKPVHHTDRTITIFGNINRNVTDITVIYTRKNCKLPCCHGIGRGILRIRNIGLFGAATWRTTPALQVCAQRRWQRCPWSACVRRDPCIDGEVVVYRSLSGWQHAKKPEKAPSCRYDGFAYGTILAGVLLLLFNMFQ